MVCQLSLKMHRNFKTWKNKSFKKLTQIEGLKPTHSVCGISRKKQTIYSDKITLVFVFESKRNNQ